METKELTYRIALTDSENRSIQIDVELHSLGTGKAEKALVDIYATLLKEELEGIKKIQAEDEAVTKKDNKKRSEKIKALADNVCDTCELKWKGGSDKCPDVNCESNMIKEE